jgi:hypothetical protein
MAVTYHELTKTPHVLGVFNRLKASGLALSNYYGLGPNSPATEISPKRSLVYDLFDNTRTMARGRGPYVGPGKTAPKRMGQATAHAMRLYEAIPLLYERIYQGRPLGAQIGEVDATGQAYIGRQQKFMAQRFMNSIEFMVSRMFRGGFSILVDGDDWLLRELGAGTIDVEYPIPANHKTTCAVGGANGTTAIFGNSTSSWDNIAAPVIQQLLNLNRASERETGYVQKHIWINSTTYGHLLNNTQLSDVRGIANRIFDTQSGVQIPTTDAAREQGYTVVFGAIPQFQFHVYDAVSHVSVNVDSATGSELSMYIPDNIAIITPEPAPGEWYGSVSCSEPIRENDQSEIIYPNGLHSWSYPTNDPPGVEMRTLHNFAPLLYNPKATFYATVIS